MTVAATELAVHSRQAESRVARMVERRIEPVSRAMAVLAFAAAASVVRVVFRVASEAGRRRVRKRMVRVAAEAGGGFVMADEVEACSGVIESHLGPVGRGMAVAALRTK